MPTLDELRRGTALVATGLALTATLAACATASETLENDQDALEVEETSAAPTEAPATETDVTPGGDTEFVDGTYTADGSYQSPNGTESVTVTVTVAADLVTEVTVEGRAENPNSTQFQGQFISGIAAEVVGQDLSELSVTRVAGSSLTSGGFNAALDVIRDEARG